MIKKELRRIIKAFHTSCHGIVDSWHDRGAFRTELILTPIVIFSTVASVTSGLACIIVIVCWMVVLIAELLNTGIEASTDLACHKKKNPLARKSKDAASAAVMIALSMFLIVWIVIIYFKY